jgi:hypothetical protein
MAGWSDLARELDAWGEAGRRASVWWRDDDALDDTSALRRLIGLAAEARVPLALAVIPAGATPALAELIGDNLHVAVLQHGLTHANHAPVGEKKAEFGAHRPVADMLGDAAIGRERLAALFGPRLAPVFVPPWNRIDPQMLPFLVHASISGLSRFKARGDVMPAPGLIEANCHVDPIDWRGGGGFAGDGAVLTQLVGHLRARRVGEVDPDEPTGLLTHHLQADAEGWAHLEKLVQFLRESDVPHWLTAHEIFTLSP